MRWLQNLPSKAVSFLFNNMEAVALKIVRPDTPHVASDDAENSSICCWRPWMGVAEVTHSVTQGAQGAVGGEMMVVSMWQIIRNHFQFLVSIIEGAVSNWCRGSSKACTRRTVHE